MTHSLAKFIEHVALHEQWCEQPKNGERLDLSKLPELGKRFDGADLRGRNLRGAYLNKASFVGADLRGADLSQTSLYHANLRAAKLGGALLHKATLIEADLRSADLTGARLCGTFFTKADLRDALLYGAIFSTGEQHPLTDAFLGVDLRGADLSGADLFGISFQTAKVEGANFTGAHLEHASFRGTDVDGTRFRNAKFLNTDMTGALNYRERVFTASQLKLIYRGEVEGKKVYYRLSHRRKPWRPQSSFLKTRAKESKFKPFAVHVDRPGVQRAVEDEVVRRFRATRAQVLKGTGTQEQPFMVEVWA